MLYLVLLGMQLKSAAGNAVVSYLVAAGSGEDGVFMRAMMLLVL